MSQTFTAERMQTNAAWSQTFALSEGQGDPADLTGWVLEGRAQIAGRPQRFVSLGADNGRLTVETPASGVIVVSLSAADCATLGPGMVEIELMRVAPAPRRPVLRAAIENHAGLVP